MLVGNEHPCYHGNDQNLAFHVMNVVSYRYILSVANWGFTNEW